jgi:hypothetical protein
MRRFVDTELTPLHHPPVHDFSTHQLVSLQHAIEPLISRNEQLDRYIEIAESRCHFPSEHGLTRDESAAIFLYTMGWDDNSFYQVISEDLRAQDQSVSELWLPYLKLFDTAVQKLPNVQINVWRGVNEDISMKLKEDDELIWWNITSCSSAVDVIKDFLEPNSTLFLIEVVNGKDISNYSYSPNQHEVILCPGTRLHVVSNTQDQMSLPMLHLRERERQLASSSVTNDGARFSPLRWCKNRLLSFWPPFIILIIALLLVTPVGKLLTTFASSHISTMLPRPLWQAMQFPWRNIHIHVDELGNRFEGQWRDGKKHGKGKMDFANGYRYEGTWIDDMATGEGVFIWTNGDRYEGQFKYGQRHGKGSYKFANGDQYTGDWAEDKKSGHGISILAEGKYEGQFKDDKMDGKGSYVFANGDTYIGDWVDNKQEGQGIFNWTNGDRYEETGS